MSVRVRCPATSANLGPGFDALGIALGLYNTFEVELAGDGVTVEASGPGAESIPSGEGNLTAMAFRATWSLLGEPTSWCTKRPSVKMNSCVPRRPATPPHSKRLRLRRKQGSVGWR